MPADGSVVHECTALLAVQVRCPGGGDAVGPPTVLLDGPNGEVPVTAARLNPSDTKAGTWFFRPAEALPDGSDYRLRASQVCTSAIGPVEVTAESRFRTGRCMAGGGECELVQPPKVLSVRVEAARPQGGDYCGTGRGGAVVEFAPAIVRCNDDSAPRRAPLHKVSVSGAGAPVMRLSGYLLPDATLGSAVLGTAMTFHMGASHACSPWPHPDLAPAAGREFLVVVSALGYEGEVLGQAEGDWAPYPLDLAPQCRGEGASLDPTCHPTLDLPAAPSAETVESEESGGQTDDFFMKAATYAILALAVALVLVLVVRRFLRRE